MQCSKLDIGRADAGAGGMSIRSGMGASSSSSDASSMAQSTGSSGAVAKSSSREWSDAALRGGRKHSTTLLHDGHRALAGVDAGRVPEKDPRLQFFAQVQHVVQCGCELQDRGRGGPAVLGRDVMSALLPGLLRQDGVCPARLHDLHQHVQSATVHAEGDRECRGLLGVALQLSLLHATAPPDLLHREEPA